MRRWRGGLALGLVIALGVGLAALLAGPAAPGPTSVGRAEAGWLAARLYLEARGAEARLERRALDAPRAGEVLLVSFPGRLPLAEREVQGLERWVAGGGALVLGLGRQALLGPERALLEALGSPEPAADDEAVAAPRPARGPVRLEARAPWQGRPIQIGRWGPQPVPPAGSEVLYVADPGGRATPAVYRFEHGRGQVWVLPAEALANGRLREPGNADLLETLLTRLGPRFAFAERHHGLLEPTAGAPVSTAALDIFGLHLLLLYLAGLWALGRRFGRPWAELPPRHASARGFLLGLGRLAEGLGVEAEAARLLVARTAALERRRPLPAELLTAAEQVRSTRELVTLAQRLAAWRQGAPTTPDPDSPRRTST